MGRATKVFLGISGGIVFLLGGTFIAATIFLRDVGPPPIAKALFPDQQSEGDFGTSRAFDALIKQKFPVGSNESAMVTELRAQGFLPFSEKVSDACVSDPPGRPVKACGPGHFVYFFGTICGAQLFVDWKAAENRLTNVAGSYNYVCP
ncbi:MAG: hypothetical protein ACTHPD_15345 [Rhizomicrobium sp.]